MKIIIVDDDCLVVSSLKTILKANGFDIIATGSNGNEAITLFNEYKPDILLMDIRMQNMTGIEASEKILAEHKDAKILLLTTFNDEEYITKAINLLSCRQLFQLLWKPCFIDKEVINCPNLFSCHFCSLDRKSVV